MSMQPIQAGAVPPITLATRLRVAREYAGLEQGQLAERAQIARNTISRSERGATVPNRATITMWALACGVDVRWLLTGETEAAPDPEGAEAGSTVRLEGLEPPTFCSEVVAIAA